MDFDALLGRSFELASFARIGGDHPFGALLSVDGEIVAEARLMELAAAPGNEPFGFTITAPEIGSRACPPMRIDGPHREDEAALAHVGFWPA